MINKNSWPDQNENQSKLSIFNKIGFYEVHNKIGFYEVHK